MSGYYEEISDDDKIRISSNFLLHSPPGEFNEVFNDVRILLSNDELLKGKASAACAKYNKDQYTPCKLEGVDHLVLVTEYGDQGNGRYLDPRSGQTFHYDHLRKEASDPQPAEVANPDTEPTRLAVDTELAEYLKDHYKYGVSAVYGKADANQLIVCVESHQFQPKNYWNGRWRSLWVADIGDEVVELVGTLRVQVHYYEDGNVQLVSSKSVRESLKVTGAAMAKGIVKAIREAETDYQSALSDNYNTMSDTTFKAMRRALPVTRKLMEWDKLGGYRIGKELQQGAGNR